MTEDKQRQPGRPRLYDTTSAKVEAFRKRQESAGFLRKEVLVTKDTADQLAALAKTHRVSVTDVASALLEHGLAGYQQELNTAIQNIASAGVGHEGFLPEMHGTAALGGVIPSGLSYGTQGRSSLFSSQSAGASASSGVSEAGFSGSAHPGAVTAGNAVNPINSFFARRKESLNEPKS